MIYNTLLKIILLLLIITSIVYVLLCQCKQEHFDLDQSIKFTLSHDLLGSGIEFSKELECIDHVKLQLLQKNNTQLNQLTSQEHIDLNKTAKNMCEHDSCDELICTYKKHDNVPPGKINTLKHKLINNIIELSWFKPISKVPIEYFLSALILNLPLSTSKTFLVAVNSANF